MVANAGGGSPSVDVVPYLPVLLREWPEGAKHRMVDGTMVHVDISGFTAMSERLARKGKVGAEEVALVLNNTFTELLTLADESGGDLLKFGGDALLLFFDGEGHALRAARATASMRRRLRSIGKVATPAGNVSLRMRGGLHSDRFHFFLTGDMHRELIVAGPAASRTVMMEESAEVGEIVLSMATARLLDDRFVGSRRGRGRLLQRMPPATSVPPRAATQAAEDLTDLIPLRLRRTLTTGTAESEHRRATIAFVKFKGTDELVQSQEADEVWSRLDEIVRVVQSAANTYGVTFLASDVDVDGGKLILAAGVPSATGNDDERMLLTLRNVLDLPAGSHLAAGINRGSIFAGDVGARFRRTYTVIGDGVNLSARVMAKAGPGRILATMPVLERSRSYFETEELPPFAVKGKSKPIRAASVGRLLGVRDPSEQREVPLVGRDQELKRVMIAFDAAGAGKGSIVEIVGPAGIGKSRLLGAARETTMPDAWVKVGCDEYGQSIPYSGFGRLLRTVITRATGHSTVDRRLLKSVVANRVPELASWIPLIAVPLGIEVPDTAETRTLDPDFKKDRTHSVTLDFMEALLPEPAAIVIDNAQWLDDVSGELIERLAARIDEQRLLLCLARREGTPCYEVPDVPTIGLEPLDPTASLELGTVATAANPIPQPRLVQAVERSGGNPLFLLELVGAQGEDLPGSIEDLVAARIDNLDPEFRKLVRYAAAIGRTFDPELLKDMADDIPAAQQADTWEELGDYIERLPEGSLRFRQNLFRDVAYSGLPFRTRRDLHKRIGESLERSAPQPDDDAAILSLHFSLAEEAERAWRYSVLAGDRARDEHANLEASDFYRRALRAGKRVTDVDAARLVDVAEALGDVLELAGLYDDADEAFGEARRTAEDDAHRVVTIMGKQGMLREKAGNLPQALRWFTRALALLDGGDSPEVRAELYLGYSGVRFRQGRFDDTVRWAEQALEALGPEGGDEQRAHAYSLLLAAYPHLNRSGAEDVGKRALEIYERLGDLVGTANVLNNMGVSAYYLGRWRAALEYWERSKEARERAGDVIGAATQVMNIGEILLDQGHLQEAEEHFQEALTVWRGASYHVGGSIALMNLGRAAARAGHRAIADESLAAALEQVTAMGARAYVTETKIRMAENHLYAGRTEEAATLLAELARAQTSLQQMAGILRLQGFLAINQGDRDRAIELFRASLDKAIAAESDHEALLSIEALIRVVPPTEREPAWAEREAEIVSQLDIVATPAPPIRIGTAA